MKTTPEAWEAITRIINVEFVARRQRLTPRLLKQLILEVSKEYEEDVDTL